MLVRVAYTASEGRQELLDGLAGAIDELGVVLAALGGAYELLDERTADALEEQLFGPVQRAYGRAKRTHLEFAGRHGLTARAFEAHPPGVPSTGAQGFIDEAVAAVGAADIALAEVQDSPPFLEVGDAELRSALVDVRSLIGDLPQRARDLARMIGR
jgi:hypothetical protein